MTAQPARGETRETPAAVKPAHTPGPWSVGNTERQRISDKLPPMFQTAVHVGERANRGNCIATVGLGGPGATRSDEMHVQANARLIAAAPDLLEVARSVVQSLRYQAESAGLPPDQLCRYDRTLYASAVAAIAKATGARP